MILEWSKFKRNNFASVLKSTSPYHITITYTQKSLQMLTHCWLNHAFSVLLGTLALFLWILQLMQYYHWCFLFNFHLNISEDEKSLDFKLSSVLFKYTWKTSVLPWSFRVVSVILCCMSYYYAMVYTGTTHNSSMVKKHIRVPGKTCYSQKEPER